MDSNRAVKQATGILAILLAGMIAIGSLGSGPMQLFFFFIWIWAFIILSLYLKSFLNNGQLLRSVMYLLLITTFFNQSFLSIRFGFFSLFTYRLLLIAALIVFFFYIARHDGLSADWRRLQVKGILLFLLFWMAYGGVSLIWSESVLDGIKYLFLMGVGVAFVFLSVFTFTRMSRLLTFYSIWMIMTAGLLVLGLINYFGHIQLPTSALYGAPPYKIAYPTAVFTNQNDFATFLSISFFFYLSAARNILNTARRTAALLLAGLSFFMIVVTDSRASVIGIAVGGILYLFLFLPPKAKRVSILACSAAILFGLIVFSKSLIAKFSGLFLDTASYSVNATLSSNVIRGNLLKDTFHYLADTFGLGVGAGNLPYYLEYQPISDTGHIYQVHNWLAEILGNFGLMIALGYVTMYACLFAGLYRASRLCSGRAHRMLIEGCLTAMAAFAVSSVSPSSVSNLYFHWVFLGLLISAVSVLKNEALNAGGINTGKINDHEGAYL
ncbi:teichuronic acid biosynthesis protein TuaE [Sporolactobacillus sp. KGMB 08714]|uniref:teichuronic acid biosynthesis protein TuaE n=1 Tax=Sporolactobacillus sp. KGMB 08714 TaxID=3064704 RepID=UPI002FBEF601